MLLRPDVQRWALSKSALGTRGNPCADHEQIRRVTVTPQRVFHVENALPHIVMISP